MTEKVEPHPPEPVALGIIGMGRLGTAFSKSFEQLPYLLRTLNRDGFEEMVQEKQHQLSTWLAGCTVVFLCVRDDQLEGVINQLSRFNLDGKTVLMHAGALPLSILQPLAKKGAVCGKFHPLMSFSGAQGALVPLGTPFAYEGPIFQVIKPWVDQWQSPLYLVEGDAWQWYHLAAVLAANFLPLLIRGGATIMSQIPDTHRARSLAWLSPLVQQTVANALNSENHFPYSGPAVRGDLEVLAKQKALLAENFPEWAPIYQLLSTLIMQEGQAFREKKS